MEDSPTILADASEVRLEDVAARIGTARATLYYYFSGRDDLISFVLTEHIGEAAELITRTTSGDRSPGASLRAVTAGLLDFLGEHPGLCTTMLASLGSGERMNDALHAHETLVAGPVRELITAGIATGELRAGDADFHASALLGGILFVAQTRAERRRSDETPDLTSSQLADQLLHGLLQESPPPTTSSTTSPRTRSERP